MRKKFNFHFEGRVITEKKKKKKYKARFSAEEAQEKIDKCLECTIPVELCKGNCK